MNAATLLLLTSAGALAEEIHVPSTFTRLSDAISYASQNGTDRDTIVIDGADTRWSPSAERYVSVFTDVDIESANEGVPVLLPGLKIYDATATFTDVDVVGYYQISSDADYQGVVAAARVVMTRSNVTFTRSDLSYDANYWAETGLVAHDSIVTLDDVTLNGYTDQRAAFVLAEWEDAELTMLGGEVARNEAGGLALYGSESSFSSGVGSLIALLDGVAFTDNTHPSFGGAIEASLVSWLGVNNATFVGNGAEEYGGAISAFLVGELIVEGAEFDGARTDGAPATTPYAGHAIEVTGSQGFPGEVSITNTRFTQLGVDMEVGVGGAIFTYAVDLELSDVSGSALAAGGGALLFAEEGTVDAERVQLVDYEVGVLGGGLYLDYVDPTGAHNEHGLRELFLCAGDDARYEGQAVALVLDASFASIENSVFMANSASTSPLILVADAELLLSHSTFAANEVDTLIVGVDAPDMWLDANILDGNSHSELALFHSAEDGELFGANNLWWGFTAGPWASPNAFPDAADAGSQILDQDPLFMFPETFGGCPGAAYVYHDSPAVDADTDGELGIRVEWDDTIADLGAAGGTPYIDFDPVEDDDDGDGVEDRYDCDPSGPNDLRGEETWYDGLDYNCDRADDFDADGDGWRGQEYGEDCDDNDEDVNPGAEEVWYDGIDQNCDGQSDYDADGDGSKADHITGGADCDDADPSIGPDVVEIDGDGIDQDCDGVDGTALTGAVALTGGCASAPGAPLSALSLLGFGLLLVRRRR